MEASTAAADADLLPIIVDGTPKLSRHITVGDFRARAFGEISVNGGASAQGPLSIGVWTKLTPFDTNGVSLNATPDHSNDKIEVDDIGIYRVSVAASFFTDNTVDVELGVYWNGGLTQLRGKQDVDTALTRHVAFSGLVDVTTGATDFELYCRMDVSRSITVVEGLLVVERL